RAGSAVRPFRCGEQLLPARLEQIRSGPAWGKPAGSQYRRVSLWPVPGLLRYRRRLGQRTARHSAAFRWCGNQGVDLLAGDRVSSAGGPRGTDRHDGHDLLMDQPLRGSRMSRRSWLVAGLAAPLFSVRAAEPLEIKYDGDNLHVAAPSLHFLIGKPLERLKDGASVGYLAQLTLFGDDHITQIKRRQARFVVSYAL